MPVSKHRSVLDMEGTRWAARLAPENLRQAAALSRVAYRLRPWRWPAGVRRYRSIEEAQRAREEWETPLCRQRGPYDLPS